MAKKIMIIVLTVLLASYAFIVALPKGLAADPVVFYLDPAKIENEALTPNTTFNISAKVDDIPADPGLAGIEFNVTWDQSILNGVALQDIIFHEVTPESDWSNIWQLKRVVANNSVNYAFTFQDIDLATQGGYAPISGSHTVANITLKVVGTGTCSLNFTVHKLGDLSGSPIDHIVQNATFSNVAAPPPPQPALLYVDPDKIVNASLSSGTNFTVNVNIANASSVAGLEFKLGFNASVLNAQTVTSGSFIPVSVTPITEINATGYVRFNASVPTLLNGNGILAVIQFQVMADNVKNSTLHIYDVSLVDNAGQPLPISTPKDGSFTNLKKLEGDLNGDGIVDINDAIMFSHAFGSKPSDPDWNPDADLDGNGEIDIFDLILIAMRFGQKA